MNVVILDKIRWIDSTWEMLHGVAIISTICSILFLLVFTYLLIVVGLEQGDIAKLVFMIILALTSIYAAINIPRCKGVEAYKIAISDTVPLSYVKEHYTILEMEYPYIIVDAKSVEEQEGD